MMKKLKALFLMLESVDNNDYLYSAEDINMLEKSRENYVKGEGKNFTVEEPFEEIRKRK